MSKSPFPVLHPVEKAGKMCCGSCRSRYAPPCGKPAAWHVAWTLTPPAQFSLMCEEHMKQALGELVFADRHRARILCDMPGSGWLLGWPSQCALDTTEDRTIGS